MSHPPSQSHSVTSVASARSLSKARVHSQERWVYETVRRNHPGLSDWQLWDRVQAFVGLFDKETSLHRARIGLRWRSRVLGETPWHPLEDSGRENINPSSGKKTTIWRIKTRYLTLTYDEWARVYRALARASHKI